jgi:2-polyprenyl-3-methyl-5-hydroxy-6-metoxy-1,4-benzoquinol methylase
MEVSKKSQINIDHNKSYYDEQYKNVNINSILSILNNLDEYLEAAITSDISWVGMYSNNLKDRIKGKTILELGCGDCVNVAIMAALGAKVVANDISDQSGEIVKALNNSYNFEHNITFINGDFTQSNLEKESLDFVIGKAFLHHLTIPHERKIIEGVVKGLRTDGEARFFEPAINSKLLDELRWAMPMNNRPSKWLQPKAFKQWEENDPHPERDNNSKHFISLGNTFFNSVEIIPLGIFERFNRLLPLKGKLNGAFKRKALNFEKIFPNSIRRFGARSQVIIYKNPKISIDV